MDNADQNKDNFTKVGVDDEDHEDFYRHIFEKAPIGIIHYNKEGIITACNDQFVEILGSTKEKLLGLKMTELPNPKMRETVKKALNGNVGIFEGVYKSVTSGKSVPLRVEFHPIKKYETGHESGIGMVQDISERYFANQRLKESEERYRTIFTNSSNVMLLIDIDSGKIADANKAAEKFYGLNREELQEKFIHEINVMTFAEVKQEMEKARKEESNLFHFKHKLASGEIRDVEVYSGIVKVEGEHFLHSIINDVTERLKAEQDLKKFKLGIERSPNIVFITNLKGEMEYVNPSFSRTYGFSYDEAVGKNPRILKSGLYDDKYYESFWKMISSGDVVEGDIINKTKDGKFIDVRVSANPIIDDENNIIGYLAIQEDVTEQKKKDEQLHESLKEKEVLLYEIHHRVKNNLAIISALLELNLYQDQIDDTEEIIKASQLRIKAMANVHEMLYKSDSFSSISFGQYIERLVESSYQSIDPKTPRPKFVKHIDDISLNVNQAIPCGLVVNELIANAIKHAFSEDENGIIELSLTLEGDMVILSVEDNGKGIQEGVDPLELNSLGITLIKILSKQLDAELDMDNSDKGFKAKFQFKKKAALKGSSATFF